MTKDPKGRAMTQREREYAQAIAAAHTVLRDVLSDDEQTASIDRRNVELIDDWLENPIVQRARKAAE